MAASLAREPRSFLQKVKVGFLASACCLQLRFLCLLLVAVAPIPSAYSAVESQQQTYAEHGVKAGAATRDSIDVASAWTASDEGSDVHGTDHGDNVLMFQTSFDVRVPCLVPRVISPPPSYQPPARLIVASPTQNGTYPVILFKHGFDLANCFYNQLFQFLASSGYIVVAPQTVTLSMDCIEEIEQTAEVANWILTSLGVVLNAAVSRHGDVVPDLSKLVMAGHSRGGKAAFALALGMGSVGTTPSFSALITLDPVDCMNSEVSVPPSLVEAGCNSTRNQIPFPVLILGSGYGSKSLLPGIMPACAATCCDHAAYFNCTSAPIMYHVVASEYGHLDFLDDGIIWSVAVCVEGHHKELLRAYTGELMVAFLEYALEGKQESLNSMIENWETAPIKLEKPQIYYREGSLYTELDVSTPIQFSPQSAFYDVE